MSLATGNQRPEPGMVLRRRVVAGEQPVFSPYRHPFKRPLTGVVVDVEEALRRERSERLPLVLGVGNRRGR